MTIYELRRKYNDYKYIDSEDEALWSVREDGLLLEFVREQTVAVCIAAVSENAEAIKYVHPRIFEGLKRQMTINELSSELGYLIEVVD